MSQREFLADLDAALHSGFASAGMAEFGQYTPPGGTELIPCHVYVDNDVETIGGLRQFAANRVEVIYVRAPGLEPVQGGKLAVDGDIYINSKIISDDGSMSRWTVRNG